MPCQKKIALALGISQSAVSKALRGHRSISTDMRKKIHATAEHMGYHLNGHVSNLMSNIRTGKKLTDKGELGLLINAPSSEIWLEVETFRIFHAGVLQRGRELGFHIEPFFLQNPAMRISRIDQILQTRSIDGIILAPPGRDSNLPDLRWEHYAAINASVGWEENNFNQLCCNQFQNYMTAFNELLSLGYKRIGTVLGSVFIQGTRQKTRWHMGYLVCQNDIPKKNRIPVLACKNPPVQAGFDETEDKILYAEFRKWVLQWRPDVILTLVGYEKRWLEAMGLKIPQDIGVACLAQHADNRFAGIDEKPEILGATAVELVAAQIARNEFGLPAYPKMTLIAGQWKDGSTVQNRNRTTTVSA